MNIKEQWIDPFKERLWEHYTCDWDAGNRNPDYPFQLAIAYFDCGIDGFPECSVEEAFNRYLESDK